MRVETNHAKTIIITTTLLFIILVTFRFEGRSIAPPRNIK
nr:MAG TPA: hypothetical protein [Caudoviricetes sp.]